MAERLLLVRHGACEGGGAGHLIGAGDPPLTAVGRAQARALRPLLPDDAGTLFECSPRRRARQTAQLALASSGSEVRVEESLREIDFGAWEGLTFAEVARRDPGRVRRWAAWEPDFAFPGGESLAGFIERVGEIAARLASAPARTVVAFTHAGVIQVLLCRLLGLSPGAHRAFGIRYASVATVELCDGTGVLTGLVAAPAAGDSDGSSCDG